MNYLLYIVVLLIVTLVIADAMEKTKKILYKDKAPRFVIRLTALIYVALEMYLLVASSIMQYPLATFLGAKMWADVLSIYILLYFLQCKANMTLIKKGITKQVRIFLIGRGFSEEAADMILAGILPKVKK